MKDNFWLDEELCDKVEVENTEGKSDKEIKKELRIKKIFKAIKITLYAIMGSAAGRLFYKPSNQKEKNTDYLDRY